MPNDALHADAFKRFMETITDCWFFSEAELDADEVQISDLERRVRTMKRTMDRRARQSKRAKQDKTGEGAHCPPPTPAD